MKESSGMREELGRIEQYVLGLILDCKGSFATPHDLLMTFVNDLENTIIIPKENLEVIINKTIQIINLTLLSSCNTATSPAYAIAIAALIESLRILKDQNLLDIVRKRINPEYRVH
eukprot:TRINITY_DN10470_c0_g1_i4.p2 TRINITY_DN10470_c0_g1~~TRINITY_DN10470_c0_g1_i4.p2  ORF type:complete len:116 (-),score=3.49 TRINITY_DN10470_c0_g1_i4:307-654(-)